MVKPNEHYHRIETAGIKEVGPLHVNGSSEVCRPQYKSTLTLPDVEYSLTRLEGQLVRARKWNELGGSGIELDDIITQAQNFARALKLALSKDRIDVT